MNLSSICARYRERERQALKPWLMGSLIGSVGLHGGLFTFMASQWQSVEQPSTSALPANPIPVDLLMQQPTAEAAPTPSSPSSAPIALASTPTAPAAIAQAPSWATPLPSSQSPELSDQPTPPWQASAPLPAPVAFTQPPTPSIVSPLQPELMASQPEVAPSLLPEVASPVESASTSPPLTSPALPLPSPITNSESGAASTSGTAKPSPFATAFRQWFTPLMDSIPTTPGEAVGASGSKAGRGQSLGLGASNLGGLVARSLSQGWLQLPGNSAIDAASQTTCISCNKPSYPLAAQQQGRQGAVKIGLDYDAEGNITAVHLLQSSGSDDLDRAAMAEAKHWKLKPGNSNKRQFVAAIDFQTPGREFSNSGESPQPDLAREASAFPPASKPVKDTTWAPENPDSRRGSDTPRVADLESAPTGAAALQQPAQATPTIQPKAEPPVSALEPVAPPEPAPLSSEPPSQSLASEPVGSGLATPVPPHLPSSEEQTASPEAQQGGR
ncbi:MAG: energy transducer TonB [Leptolyngbyaceae cyanobacterium]